MPPVLQALAQTGLADQVEQLTITPVYLGLEDSSKLWTSFQTNYRSSMAYRVSSVIIAADEATVRPLPVLMIGADNRGPEVLPSLEAGPPSLRAIVLPQGQPSARPGDTITLSGTGLDGSDLMVRFDSSVLNDPIDLPPDAGGSARIRSVTIPDDPAVWATGQFSVSFLAATAPGAPPFQSNSVAFQLAPIPDLPPVDVSRSSTDEVQVTLDLRPNIWPGQRVELILGSVSATAPNRTAAEAQAIFSLPDLPAGNYPLRLRVDGVESWLVQRELPPIPPDFAPVSPAFDLVQAVTVPA